MNGWARSQTSMSLGRRPGLPKWRIYLDGLASLSIIVACLTVAAVLVSRGALFDRRGTIRDFPAQRPGSSAQAQILPKEPVSISDSAVRGSKDAQLAVIEFTDFQCPYCAQFSRTTLLELEEAFVKTGKVLLVVKHLPLEKLHPQALPAAIAAECARREGRFWEVHDRLFQSSKLDPLTLAGHLAEMSFGSAFDACVAGDGRRAVLADVAVAAELGIRGTPGFLLGRLQSDGRIRVLSRLSGAVPFDRLRSEIEHLLSLN